MSWTTPDAAPLIPPPAPEPEPVRWPTYVIVAAIVLLTTAVIVDALLR
jgi:hypothetical protein